MTGDISSDKMAADLTTQMGENCQCQGFYSFPEIFVLIVQKQTIWNASVTLTNTTH